MRPGDRGRDKSRPYVDVRFEAKAPGVSAGWARGVVGTVLKSEKSKCRSVGVLITDNRRIQKINKRFLKHDTATDVISFGAEEPGYLGDVVVSAEMAGDMARELKISFREELARYLVHGTLHLLGYDDKKKSDHARMHARQEALLKKI